MDASCPSFLVRKYKNCLISCSDLCFLATVTIGCAGHNFLSLDRFLLSWGVCCVRLRCVLPFACWVWCVSTFPWKVSEPYRKMVRLVFLVVLLLFAFVCNFGLLAFYSKFVTTFPTGSAGRNLTHRFNLVNVVIPTFTYGLLQLIQLISWFPYCYRFEPFECWGDSWIFHTLRSFHLVVVFAICAVDFRCVLLLGVVYPLWCPIFTTRRSGHVRV